MLQHADDGSPRADRHRAQIGGLELHAPGDQRAGPRAAPSAEHADRRPRRSTGECSAVCNFTLFPGVG